MTFKSLIGSSGEVQVSCGQGNTLLIEDKDRSNTGIWGPSRGRVIFYEIWNEDLHNGDKEKWLMTDTSYGRSSKSASGEKENY